MPTSTDIVTEASFPPRSLAAILILYEPSLTTLPVPSLPSQTTEFNPLRFPAIGLAGEVNLPSPMVITKSSYLEKRSSERV